MSLAFANIVDDIPGQLPRDPLHPEIYVEPKDRDAASEDSRQAAFVVSMRKLAPRCIVAANVNAGKRTRWAAAKAKREGLLKGRNDLDVLWTGGLALIEFKAGRTMPDADQVVYLNAAARMGHHVAICRTAAGAMAWLHSVGAPVLAQKGGL